MDNKRKRSFFDDDDENQIRKMPKTSNSTTDYSLDTDTEETKLQDLCESTYSRSQVCMSIITISDDSSVEESASLAEDCNAIHYKDHAAVQNICTANSPSECTNNRSFACISTITISDDSSVEESESLAEDCNALNYEDHVAVKNICCTGNSLSESTNNRQHTFKSIIFISDDSSVEESASLAEDRKDHYEDHVAVQNICTTNSLGESTINRHQGDSSVSENLTMGTKRSLHNCPTDVPTFSLTTCEHFEEGSTTHIKLENPNCSKLEDQDFDDKNSLSTSYVPTQKTVLQKCSSAEALETYEYVEHKVSVQNVGCLASIVKVMDWNCDPTSSLSYDWNMMDTEFPKKESKSESSWSS